MGNCLIRFLFFVFVLLIHFSYWIPFCFIARIDAHSQISYKDEEKMAKNDDQRAWFPPTINHKERMSKKIKCIQKFHRIEIDLRRKSKNCENKNKKNKKS